MLASPLHATSVSKGAAHDDDVRSNHYAHHINAHGHQRRGSSHPASPAAELSVEVVQVSAISFRKVVESSMLPQHGLRCKFHLSVGGKSIGVVGMTASTAGQANALAWGANADGRTALHLNVSPSMNLSLGIEVLCGSLVVASTVVLLRELEPTGRIELTMVYNAARSSTSASTGSSVAFPTRNKQLGDNDLHDANYEYDNRESVDEGATEASYACSSSYYNDENDHDSDDESDIYPSHDSDGEPSPEKQDHPRHHAATSMPFANLYKASNDHQRRGANNAEGIDAPCLVHPLPASALDDLDHLVDRAIHAKAHHRQPFADKRQAARHDGRHPQARHGPTQRHQLPSKGNDFDHLFRYGIASTTKHQARHHLAPSNGVTGNKDDDDAASVLSATDTNISSHTNLLNFSRRIVDMEVAIAATPPPPPSTFLAASLPTTLPPSNDAVVMRHHHHTLPADQSQGLADRMFQWTQRIALLEKKAAGLQGAQPCPDDLTKPWTKPGREDTPTATLIRERRQSLPLASQPQGSGTAGLHRSPPKPGLDHSVHVSINPTQPNNTTESTTTASTGDRPLRRSRSASVRGFQDLFDTVQTLAHQRRRDSAAGATPDASAPPPPSLAPTCTSSLTSAQRLELGRRIVIGGTPGTVRFIGATEFGDGIWVGIELTRPHGKNDGSVNGVSYFSCPQDHGIFVQANRLDVTTR